MPSENLKKDKFVDLITFSSIELSETYIKKNKAESQVTLRKINGDKKKFRLGITYEEAIKSSHVPLINLAFFMPLLNYGLFCEQFILDFTVSQSDIILLDKLNSVFNKDIFVNKILKAKTTYFLKEKLAIKKDVCQNDMNLRTPIKPLKIIKDEIISKDLDQYNFGILSSGGKDSLLTYCMIKEIGYNVYPLYVNESGGHWRTSISAYKFHKKTESNTMHIWTNVDRFYNFMLDNLEFVRQDHRKIRGEAYPIRTCIFPFYVFSLLPLFVKNRIGNLLIGSEFDDLDNNSHYNEIHHYYGVYDQHQDYDILMNKWYKKRIPCLVQWSALRNISGFIVEKILANRYHEFLKYQRSCHSCYFENKEIFQCGKCSKCMNILLFLLLNNVDPKIINFKERDINLFSKRIKLNNLKLDHDEKYPSFEILNNSCKYLDIKPIDHIEKFHINPDTCNPELIPRHVANKLIEIIENYTTGFCELKNNEWLDVIEIKK